MSEWRPIDTAPKDEPIIVYVQSGRIWAAQVSSENGNCYMLKLDGRPIMLRASHWMPMPEPPEQTP